jgi:hypothetical protein
MQPMTLADFESELKALLQKAEDSGLDIESFCACAEHIIETGWPASIRSNPEQED